MESIESVIEAQVGAWNRGDIGAFVALYTDDAEYVGRQGRVQGRTALAEQYKRAYPDRAAMGHLGLQILSQVSGADVTMCLVSWTVGPVGGHALLGFVRGPEGWQVRYDMTMT